MARQVDKTDRIVQLMRRSTGDAELVADGYAVYEARSFNTRPIQKKGSLYENSVTSVDVLRSMAGLFDKGNETVPLLAQHRSGLPFGQVFHAEVVGAADGQFDLNSLFYVPTEETDLIARLDKGVIKEVSVGLRTKSLLCSACAFDYMSDKADFENFYERCCDKGHQIGQNGVHAIGSGLDRWFELSLVDRGAAQDTAILPKGQQIAANDRAPVGLAACVDAGKRPYLTASFSDEVPVSPPASGKTAVDPEILRLSAEAIVHRRDLDAAATKATADAATIGDLTAKLAARDAELVTARKGDLAVTKAELDAAQSFLAELVTASLTAIGKGSDPVPDSVADRIKVVREARQTLSVTIPVGGASASAVSDADKPRPRSYAAFSGR